MKKIIRITKLLLIVTAILSAIFFTNPPAAIAESEKTPAKAEKDKSLSETFPDMPKFDSTSKEQVLLRYKFKAGQSVKMNVNMLMDNLMQFGGRDVNIGMTITMEAGYIVKSVDANGDAWAVLTITRMTMKASGPQSQNIAYDSAEDTGTNNPNLQALKVLLNASIPVRVSALGKLLEVDRNPMREAVRRAGAAAKLMNFEKTADEAIKGSFVQLSQDPVKAGDIYEAGTIVQTVEAVGEMTMNARYKVFSISGDKKQVLLQPIGEFKLKATPEGTVKMKLNSGKVDGWILLDLEKGYIVRSAGLSGIDLSMSQGGQTMRLKTDTKIKCQSRLEG